MKHTIKLDSFQRSKNKHNRTKKIRRMKDSDLLEYCKSYKQNYGIMD